MGNTEKIEAATHLCEVGPMLMSVGWTRVRNFFLLFFYYFNIPISLYMQSDQLRSGSDQLDCRSLNININEWTGMG